jgi:hypothetical protein
MEGWTLADILLLLSREKFTYNQNSSSQVGASHCHTQLSDFEEQCL